MFPGLALAQRLECSDAENARVSAEEYIDVSGGVVAFGGPSSPLTHAIGIGMNGPVSESDLDRIEVFYRERGAPSNIDLCPLADPALMERLGRRGYRITEFNNVLYRDLDGAPERTSLVRILEPADVWARTMISGFFGRDDLSADELAIGLSLFRMPGGTAFLAEIDGAPAAAGAARLQGTLATLFGDSTLLRFRGRGLQPAIIARRLAWAAEHRCELATAATVPGTVSQRNYMRLGFQIAYTKMNMLREL